VKDNELRDLLSNIERRIEASTATIMGGDTKEVIDRINERLNRIQELVEAHQPTGRQIYDDAAAKETNKLLSERLARIQEVVEAGRRFDAKPNPFEPPSPVLVPAVVGALLFAAGMLTVWLIR